MAGNSLICPYCGGRLRLYRRMKNIDKWICKKCKRIVMHREFAGNNSLLPRLAYIVFDHQGKSNRYVAALNKRFEQLDETKYGTGASFCLTDNDILGRVFRLEKYRQNGGVGNFFVYPHTARPNIVNDIYAPWPHTTANFVVASGHVEVMQAYGCSKPLHVVGWHLCPIRPFSPKPEPREVLFAPIHPRCSKVDQDLNAETFRRLYKLAQSDDIHLTVRFIRSLIDSGLQKVEHPNVTYVTGLMNQAYNHIDKADVVVGHQTFAWLSVARGVPTVMMAEESMPTHVQPRSQSIQYARNWKKYVHLLAYPLDIVACDDTLGLLRRAVGSNQEIADWRKRMIGQPFSPTRLIEAVEKYL